MFKFLLLMQLIGLVTPRTRFALDDSTFVELFENEMNDPNLNPGFDIEAFRQDQLDLHNHYRFLHAAPLMTRDQSLTTQAQEFAEYLAAQNTGLVHCAQLIDCDPHGAGENLALASGSVAAETNATKAWYDEIWDYNFCYESNGNGATRPGREGKPIGHFTQVVWEGSTQLGIGYARTADRRAVYVVARYKPPGNVRTRYQQNVKVPSYILGTFQNNCNGINGSLSAWMGPGECTRSCGGGVRLNTRTCTNPKPSLNGRDCEGDTKELATTEWCNTQTYDGCPSETEYRDLQCSARGFTSGRHHNFGGSRECTLHCFLPGSNTVSNAGPVDDGTHCSIGACVSGECSSMSTFVPVPVTPPPSTPLKTTMTQSSPTPPKITTTQPPPTPPEITNTQPPPTPPEITTTQPPPTPPDITTTQPPPTPPEITTTQPPPTPPEITTTQPPPTPPEITTTQSPPTPPEITTTQPPPTAPETTTTAPPTTPSIVTNVLRAILRARSFNRLLTVPTGGTNITLSKINSTKVVFYYRWRRTNTSRTGGWRPIFRQCPTSQEDCSFPNVTVPDGYELDIAFYVLPKCRHVRVFIRGRCGRRGRWSRRGRWRTRRLCRGRWITRRVCSSSTVNVALRYQYYI